MKNEAIRQAQEFGLRLDLLRLQANVESSEVANCIENWNTICTSCTYSESNAKRNTFLHVEQRKPSAKVSAAVNKRRQSISSHDADGGASESGRSTAMGAEATLSAGADTDCGSLVKEAAVAVGEMGCAEHDKSLAGSGTETELNGSILTDSERQVRQRMRCLHCP